MAQAVEPPEELDASLRSRRHATGTKPGSRYVQIVRPFATAFHQRSPNHLVARESVLAPTGGIGLWAERLRRALVGRRIPTYLESRERIGVIKGLAVFASDNISSSAYATEEIMRVLVLAGAGTLVLTLPFTLAIVGVLAIVVISYQQTIRAYPSGGGSYIVASDNLGRLTGLVAAGALLTDYVLTVAVSIAAGVAALTSIFPALFEQRVLLSVVFIGLLWLGNLRGIRESASIFAIPTYVYLFAIYGLLGLGVWLAVSGSLPPYHPPAGATLDQAVQPLGVLLILRAFTSGAVALTGTEAVSNGVPAFSPPESRNARIVLVMMGTFFGSIFIGISFLASQLGVLPDPSEQETVISQIARTLTGDGSAFHYLIQLSTAFLLLLAANTAFADFPRLASILGRDRFLPRQFAFRGDRLAFSVGIGVLALLAMGLVIAFQGSVTALIPLYTVGVFLAFTLSQVGMVRHWRQAAGTTQGWRWRAAVNALGAVATAVVAVIAGASKFALGAWVVLLLIPMLVLVMVGIRRHYDSVERSLAVDWAHEPFQRMARPRVLVPIARLDRASLNAIEFARAISDDVTAIHVTDDADEAETMKRQWRIGQPDVDLVILESPYRALVVPLLKYIDARETDDPARPLTVVVPEFVPRHLWERLLHNQAALRLKMRLFSRPNTVVVDVPFHIR